MDEIFSMAPSISTDVWAVGNLGKPGNFSHLVMSSFGFPAASKASVFCVYALLLLGSTFSQSNLFHECEFPVDSFAQCFVPCSKTWDLRSHRPTPHPTMWSGFTRAVADTYGTAISHPSVQCHCQVLLWCWSCSEGWEHFTPFAQVTAVPGGLQIWAIIQKRAWEQTWEIGCHAQILLRVTLFSFLLAVDETTSGLTKHVTYIYISIYLYIHATYGNRYAMAPHGLSSSSGMPSPGGQPKVRRPRSGVWAKNDSSPAAGHPATQPVIWF